MKSHSGEQVNLLGSCFPVKGMYMKGMLYAYNIPFIYIPFAEVMGSNPVESPEFFRFMRQLLKLSSKCEDHIFI